MNTLKSRSHIEISKLVWEALLSSIRWSLCVLEDASEDVLVKTKLDERTLYVHDRVNDFAVELREAEYTVLLEGTEGVP